MTAGGKRRAGAGRPKGAKNLMATEARERAQQTGLTPVDYFLMILRNPLETPERRFAAAEACGSLSASEIIYNAHERHGLSFPDRCTRTRGACIEVRRIE